MAPSVKYPFQELCSTNGDAWNPKAKLTHSDQTSALTKLKNDAIDNYLKDIFRHLKEPFQMFLQLKFYVEIIFQLPEGIYSELWEVIVRHMVETNNLTLFGALKMLNDGFLQCKILLQNLNKLDDAEIKGLTKLKEYLFELTGCLDKILMFYSGLKDGNKPHQDKIRSVAKNVRKYCNKLNPEMLHSLIPKSVNLQKEFILCSVLGLQDTLAERLVNLDPDIRSHQTDKYFILCFLEEDADYSGSLTDKAAMVAKLHEMGFTENRSVVVAEWISRQPFCEHQHLSSWVQDYIEHLFIDDIFLNNDVPIYPFYPDQIDKWFPVPVERYDEDMEEEEDGSVVTTEVPVFNTTADKVAKLVKKQQEKYPKKRLYFHGTNHNAAKSILEDGIDLGASKYHCELSDGCGFYLSTDSKFSINWSSKHEVSAIVMFDIEDCISKFQPLDLTVEGRVSDLKKIKDHCRSNERLPNTLKQSYKTCDYIKAPINHQSYQICIKNKTMAEEIGSAKNIKGVIFVRCSRKSEACPTNPKKRHK